MSSLPAGKRSWKCRECGTEVLLSVTQLDPLACDACLNKMKDAGKSRDLGAAVAGPLGIWKALPETTKLGAVFVALVLGLVIGYVAGQTQSPRSGISPAERHPTHESSRENESSGAPTPNANDEDRPPPPGPGYKWVQGRKRKDGTRGAGHWAPDPRHSGSDAAKSK